MKRFTTHLVETQLNEENCSCCDNKIDADGKCGCGPDCEHCGGQHDVDEGSCGTVNASKKTVKEDYTAGSEKSQFGGHRAQLKNKEGKTSYLGAKAYKKPEHAAGEAQAYHDHYFKGRGGNERAADKAVSDYRNKNKKHMNESQDLTEGKMKDFHDMVNKGMSAAEIAKKIKMPVKDVADFMKGMKEDMKPNSDIDSHPAVKDARKQHKDGVWDGNVDRNGNAIVHIKGKPHTVTNTNTAESVGIDAEAYINEGGLWANIHAKRKRIKNGSKEQMKKPGSKGAPTDQDFKDASESVEEGLEQDGPKTKLGKSFGFGGSKAVDKYRKTKAQQRSDMNKKNDPGAAKKHLALSVVDREKADKKAKSKGTSMNKQWRMKMGYESVDLEEAMADKSSDVYKEYLLLKKRSIADLRKMVGQAQRGAVDLKSYDKQGAISDLLRIKFGSKKVKAGMGLDEAKKVSDMTPEEKAADEQKRKEYNEYQKSKRDESLDEARSSASDQAAKAGAYNGGKSISKQNKKSKPVIR